MADFAFTAVITGKRDAMSEFRCVRGYFRSGVTHFRGDREHLSGSSFRFRGGAMSLYGACMHIGSPMLRFFGAFLHLFGLWLHIRDVCLYIFGSTFHHFIRASAGAITGKRDALSELHYHLE